MAAPCIGVPSSRCHRAYSKDPLDRIDSIAASTPPHPLETEPGSGDCPDRGGTDEFFVRSEGGTVRLVVLRRAGENISRASGRKPIPTICSTENRFGPGLTESPGRPGKHPFPTAGRNRVSEAPCLRLRVSGMAPPRGPMGP